MRTRIRLEQQIIPPLIKVEVKSAVARVTARGTGEYRSRLDPPPSSEALRQVFRPGITFRLEREKQCVPQHILLVEDERELRAIYTRVLQGLGHNVEAVKNGEAGWDSLCATGLEANTYDLLIADNEIPSYSGLELAHKVRAVNLDMPIILLTGSMPANIEALHLSAVLLMPFSQYKLAQTVRQVLQLVGDE